MKTPVAGSKEFQVRALREARNARATVDRVKHKTEAQTSKPINAPVQASALQQETTMKKAKKTKLKAVSTGKADHFKVAGLAKAKKAAANLKAAKKSESKVSKPKAERTTVPALEVAAFICRDGGASRPELVAKVGIEAHPMRAKIHYVRHKRSYAVETKDGRYYATAPKAA